MIIFGTRGITSTLGQGKFFCPECSERHRFARKQVRSWFTVYFIPLVPMKVAGEFVECRQCKSKFHVDVLEHDPEQEQARVEGEFESALRRVMLLTMLADGHIGAREFSAVTRVHEQITGDRPIPDDLLTEAAELRDDERPMADHLEAIRPHLNAQGQELVVRAALAVATADGELQERELRLAADVAKGLGMMPAHFRGLIAELQDQSTGRDDD